MSLTLILILVASDVLFFSVAPNYTSYGSQHYRFENPVTNSTEIRHCYQAAKDNLDCNMTRIAYFLLAIHTKAWIFGVIYYWLTWIFLIILLGGSGLAMFQCACRRNRNLVTSNEDEDGLIDNETE